jgi:hypothetical protein
LLFLEDFIVELRFKLHIFLVLLLICTPLLAQSPAPPQGGTALRQALLVDSEELKRLA